EDGFGGRTVTGVEACATPIPNGTGNFTNFHDPVLSGSNVAFLGFGDSSQEGIYLFDGSTLSRAADTSTTIPNGTGSFTFFDEPALTGSNVAVQCSGNSSQPGIYP